MAYIAGKSGSFVINGSQKVDFKVYWEEEYDIDANTSKVVLKPYCITQSGGGGYRYYPDGTISCNGVQLIEMDSYHGTHYFDATYQTEKYIRIATGDGPQLVLTSDVITHNDDGSKSVIISVNFKGYSVGGVGVSGFSVSGTHTITLTDIPRASSITSASNITLGNNCSIKWTPASSDFKYKIKFSLGNWNYTTEFITPNTTNAYTYTGYVISGTITANNTTIYAQLPTSTSGTMTAYLYTYNSSNTQIGNASSKTFTVSIPSSVKPTLGTITLDPTDINGKNILVQGKNALTISVSGCSAGTGSSIKSYTFEGPSLSKTVTSTSASASTSVSSVTSAGNLTYTVTVTDARGRTTSKSGTITCYEYYAPSFVSFNAYRADSSGAANINGTYLKCEYTSNKASVNNTNSTSVTIYYNGASTTSTLINLGNNSTTYNVYAVVTDSYGGQGASSTITVFGQARILNITQDGTGFAIGKMAESSNLFECRWDAKFNGDIECEGIKSDTVNSTSITTTTLTVGNKSISNIIQSELSTLLQSELATFKTTILNAAYPIGSVYISTTRNTSPASLFGGTWEQLKDRFLLAAGSSYSAGATGGSATHTLTVNEMPSHSHEGLYYAQDNLLLQWKGDGSANAEISGSANAASGGPDIVTGSTGGGAAHNNMPPYLVVYMWKRTA